LRRLSNDFMSDLGSGLLQPVLQRVKADTTLCLEIRNDYINIYYRGGNLLRIRQRKGTYEAFFDKKYSNHGYSPGLSSLPGTGIGAAQDLDRWISVIPELKQQMDFWLKDHPKEEREAQQLIVRDNNFGGMSNSTDYFICDIEYATRMTDANGPRDF